MLLCLTSEITATSNPVAQARLSALPFWAGSTMRPGCLSWRKLIRMPPIFIYSIRSLAVDRRWWVLVRQHERPYQPGLDQGKGNSLFVSGFAISGAAAYGTSNIQDSLAAGACSLVFLPLLLFCILCD